MTETRWWLANRHWRSSNVAFVCSSGRCETILEYEGECIEPGCDSDTADVLYDYLDDLNHRCEHGYRMCADCIEIVAFACRSCGTVQDPEPAEHETKDQP